MPEAEGPFGWTRAGLACGETRCLPSAPQKVGVMAQACNLRTWPSGEGRTEEGEGALELSLVVELPTCHSSTGEAVAEGS